MPEIRESGSKRLRQGVPWTPGCGRAGACECRCGVSLLSAVRRDADSGFRGSDFVEEIVRNFWVLAGL